MRVALVGAELEENLGLRYIATALEARRHEVEIVPFNSEQDTDQAIQRVTDLDPQITGFSMVFTNRAREFCRLAKALREAGYEGHQVAGGHFASFNCERLLEDFPEFDSIGLGEGEDLLCDLAENLDNVSAVPGLCYRRSDGTLATNPCNGNSKDLDALPFPKRTTFHEYLGRPIASILTSRGCWRDCAFCSINAWYKRVGGKKFRIRGIENIVEEMKELYFQHGIRIFNFQDDNFFLPNPQRAAERFRALRDRLRQEGIEEIAIAVKARPDSITEESIRVLDDLGLFRVFLGVENASENGLRNLNRKCTLDQILNALRILNDFDVHIAFNLLMFEPDTVLNEILINLRFMERHVENPFNFCRAEAYAGAGLEAKLRSEGRLLGNYFGFDYRINDAHAEAFHEIANYAFFERNFSDFGLHYFNMQVDFYSQLLRRFHPQLLTQTLRGAVRNFIKHTNLDTYQCLCEIYDFAATVDPKDAVAIREFAREMRDSVDDRSRALQIEGERILGWLNDVYEHRGEGAPKPPWRSARWEMPSCHLERRRGDDGGVEERALVGRETAWFREIDPFGLTPQPIPYETFKKRLAHGEQAAE
jgi:radical SAM family protein/B12 binding protein